MHLRYDSTAFSPHPFSLTAHHESERLFVSWDPKFRRGVERSTTIDIPCRIPVIARQCCSCTVADLRHL